MLLILNGDIVNASIQRESLMRKIHKAAIAAGAISALLIGIAPPAMAAGSSCTIAPFWTTCTTGTASANPSTHDVMLLAQNCKGTFGGSTLNIKLQDVGTGQYFWYGSVPYGYEQYIRVSGLYGSYKLRLDGETFRYGQITNTIGWKEQQRAC
jgi:hypothetical protein